MWERGIDAEAQRLWRVRPKSPLILSLCFSSSRLCAALFCLQLGNLWGDTSLVPSFSPQHPLQLILPHHRPSACPPFSLTILSSLRLSFAFFLDDSYIIKGIICSLEETRKSAHREIHGNKLGTSQCVEITVSAFSDLVLYTVKSVYTVYIGICRAFPSSYYVHFPMPLKSLQIDYQ